MENFKNFNDILKARKKLNLTSWKNKTENVSRVLNSSGKKLLSNNSNACHTVQNVAALS